MALPQMRERIPPHILCFKCRANVLTCKCSFQEGQLPGYILRMRQRFDGVKKEIPMRFEFEGDTFAIDFKREYKTIRNATTIRKGVEVLVPVKSKFPYTTANLLKLDPTKRGLVGSSIYATATVGAWHREPVFSTETGRLRALRNLVRTLPKSMRPKVFSAYFSRVKKVEPKVPPSSPASVLTANLPILAGEVRTIPQPELTSVN